MATVDTIWTQGSEVGDSLLSQGSLFSESGLSLIACGLICYLCIGLTTLYVAFLMALALVALAILLALAPLFIAMLLFDSTKRFFEAWIAQLANYALVIILVASVANLMLHAVSQPLQIAYNEGGSVDRRRCLARLGLLRLRVVDPHPDLAHGLGPCERHRAIERQHRERLRADEAWEPRAASAAACSMRPPAPTARRRRAAWIRSSRKAGQQLGYQSGRAAKAVWRKINPDRIKTELMREPAHPFVRITIHPGAT